MPVVKRFLVRKDGKLYSNPKYFDFTYYNHIFPSFFSLTQSAIRNGDIIRSNGEVEKYVLKRKYNGFDISIQFYNLRDLTIMDVSFPSESEAEKYSDLGKEMPINY